MTTLSWALVGTRSFLVYDQVYFVELPLPPESWTPQRYRHRASPKCFVCTSLDCVWEKKAFRRHNGHHVTFSCRNCGLLLTGKINATQFISVEKCMIEDLTYIFIAAKNANEECTNNDDSVCRRLRGMLRNSAG